MVDFDLWKRPSLEEAVSGEADLPHVLYGRLLERHAFFGEQLMRDDLLEFFFGFPK